MAYQARGRDPLFDSDMQAALERRGRELGGLVLVVLGAMCAAMIASYTPEDPSWISATDAPVQNWMGRAGAALAAPLYMIIGKGAWAIALVAVAWGLRLMVHRGSDRAVTRVVFAPIWVAVVSVYAAGQATAPGWTHSFGMGGLFGDMMMGSVLTFLPFSAGVALKLATVALGVGVLALGAYVLGFTKAELRQTAQFLLVGVIMVYATLMSALGKGASGAVRSAQAMRAARAESGDEVVYASPRAEPRVRRAEASVIDEDEEDAPAAPAKGGLLARMPALMRRGDAASAAPAEAGAGEDRVQAKIADAVRAKLRQTPQHRIAEEAPLTKGRGRRPDPLIVKTLAPAALPPEPPLRASDKPVVAGPQVQPAIARGRSAIPPAPETVLDIEDDEDDAVEMFEPELDDPMAAFEAEEEGRGTPAVPPVAAPSASPSTAPQKRVVQTGMRKQLTPSKRAQEEAQPRLKFEENEVDYELPPLSLLMNPERIERHHLSDEALEENARMLESVLDDYGVKGEIVSVRPGPVVTMYELEPAPGLKASRVIGLADDIARSMSALSARVSTVPGRSVIGIELPNDNREMVGFREILSSRDYGDGNAKLPLALGKDIGGDPMVANLAKMPHLLIAGTTGSGKSVAINTMILSLLYKLTPADLRLVMIDPKMLELSVYDGIPHLLSPVVTDPKKAVVALKWVVGEMEDRYRKMSKMGVRNIDGYNGRVEDAQKKGEMFSRTVQTGFDDETGEPIFETEEFEPKKMPYIVVIVDEMADLMMVAGKEIEACIQRLAQMARASGIHLIMATQRPSVDVITGTIKANFPTRISFQVTSKIDSRTILGEMGAEQLLGMGDMLYMAGGAKITRCHGPFVSDEEVEEVVNHLKAFGPPDYVGGVVEGPDEDKADGIDAVLGLNTGGNTDGEDALYDQAVQIVIKDRKCSTSYIQRKLAIGYNKAARLVEQMEDQGVVSAANHVGKREILVPEAS
ncbi:DNA translocase FtsK [Litorisediminicola beolgyonensis]|uniref:DNA translocase FtsK n=1 Tax=Litorisediminicola beolgyonensis TaxID=1173614 RepID=A0ABW3ZCF9_9RHOB